MFLKIAPTESDAMTALRSFLLAVLPAGTEVIAAQDNRVPEPSGADFVVMTMMRGDRLATNIEMGEDVAFVASIAANVMTVTQMLVGSIRDGSTLFGEGIASGSTIVSTISASGGVGTYRVSPAQTLVESKLSSGFLDLTKPTMLAIQLDVHGPSSGDSLQTIATLFRSSYGVDAMAAINPAISPLYADEPRQMPFINAEQQVENRWVVQAMMQVTQFVTVPQQYADTITVGVKNVEATFPAQ